MTDPARPEPFFVTPHGVAVFAEVGSPEFKIELPRQITDDVRADVEQIKESLKEMSVLSPEVEEQFDAMVNDLWMNPAAPSGGGWDIEMKP